MNNYERQIVALTDEELERFVREWLQQKKNVYAEVERFTGPGDLGRDVVGFLSAARHEGDWHNYQCKQYGSTLPTRVGLIEIAKILYHAHGGKFTAPTRYSFVVPRGLNRNLEELVFKPSEFRAKLIADWEDTCAKNIVENQHIALDDGLKKFIEDYDFARIGRISLDGILLDAHVTPVLFKWFGADPGPAPAGKVPVEVQPSELPYIAQLIAAYGDRDGGSYSSHDDIAGHATHAPHLLRQRERFYDADAFKRYYRDNTDPAVVAEFETDVLHGVVDTCDGRHHDALARVDAVMTQAANVQASGPLAKHARVPVKQGVCHHFANDGRLRWRR